MRHAVLRWRKHFLGRALVAGNLFLIFLAVGAPPAGAHADLEGTAPVAGTLVAEPPRQILLRFTAPVEASLATIGVVNANGHRVDGGRPFHPSGNKRTVAVDLTETGLGRHLVAWRVTSVDAHAVAGEFAFRVGSPGAGGAVLDQPAGLPDTGGSAAVGALYGVARFSVFASVVLLIGGIVFLVLIWPKGLADRRADRLLRAAWIGALASTPAALALQGAHGAALPLGDAFHPTALAAAVDTRSGRLSIVRLVLVATTVLLWRRLRSGVPRSPGAPPASSLVPTALLGLGILLTLVLSGHAASGTLVGVAAVAHLLHLAGVSVWLGGLAVLMVCLLPSRDADQLAAVVPRFSAVAFASVLGICITGSFQAWRQVGSLDALAGTPYGRILMVKLALFAGLVSMGMVSRSWVRRRYRPPALAASTGLDVAVAEAPATVLARLRKAVGAELVIAVALLSITALLVNAEPARSALAEPPSARIRQAGSA